MPSATPIPAPSLSQVNKVVENPVGCATDIIKRTAAEVKGTLVKIGGFSAKVLQVYYGGSQSNAVIGAVKRARTSGLSTKLAETIDEGNLARNVSTVVKHVENGIEQFLPQEVRNFNMTVDILDIHFVAALTNITKIFGLLEQLPEDLGWPNTGTTTILGI